MAAAEPVAPAGRETVCCALILTRHNRGEILLLGSEREFRLPSIEIPRWERAAPHINSAVRRLFGIEAVCSFAAKASPEFAADGKRCYVLEALDTTAACGMGSVWMTAEDHGRCGRLHEGDAEMLRSALDEAAAFETGETSSPFVHSGWFEPIRDWVDQELSPLGRELTDQWTQFNMGPGFSLIRFETTEAAVWFKAADRIHTPEYTISVALGGLRSPFLAQLLSERGAWQAWLTEEAEGHSLEESGGLRPWTAAATSLALLQIDSVAHIESLLKAGCRDCRTTELEPSIDPFIAAVADLMAAQPYSPPRILTDSDLRTVAASLHEGCARLGALPMLPCLGHGDLNPGNILVAGDRAVFLDWAAGMIGHPFFSLEYLLALFRRLHPDRAAWVSHVRSAYLRPWRRLCPAAAIAESLALTPLLAPFAWAVGMWRSDVEKGSIHPYTGKLLRAIARRLHGETMVIPKKA